MTDTVIERTDENEVFSESVANKWNWSWLDCKVLVDIKSILPNSEWVNPPVLTDLRDYFRKIDTPGLAKCILCEEKINYGSAGKKALHNHLKTKKHVKKVLISLTNDTISSKSTSPVYGLPPSLKMPNM